MGIFHVKKHILCFFLEMDFFLEKIFVVLFLLFDFFSRIIVNNRQTNKGWMQPPLLGSNSGHYDPLRILSIHREESLSSKIFKRNWERMIPKEKKSKSEGCFPLENSSKLVDHSCQVSRFQVSRFFSLSNKHPFSSI